MRIPVLPAMLVSRATESNGSTPTSGSPALVTLPESQPAWAEKLSPNLAGFSIEMDRWPLWSGEQVGQPNAFTNQVLKNLADRTGVPPFMRIGADSEDRGHIDLSYEVYNATFPPPSASIPIPEASEIAIGKDFYALSANLPDDTPLMWGINFKYQNLTETLAQAAHVADTFQGSMKDVTKNVRLVNLEIGNEPDYYDIQGVGFDDSWNTFNYSSTWLTYAKEVTKKIKLSKDGTSFSTGAFATFGDNLIWNAGATLAGGLLADKKVKSKTTHFAEHQYSGAFGYTPTPPAGTLMDKGTIRGNLSTKYPDIQAARSNGLSFILGETNSYANHGCPGTSNTAEAAIWATDYLLQAASMGIERLHFHHGFGYRYNLFQPAAGADDGLNLTTRAHILPSYHSFLIVNEAIGTSGNAYVAELGTTNSSLSAYGIWEQGKLARMVIINSEPYLADNGTLPERSSFSVAVSNWAEGSNATVKRLSMPYTNAYSGVTWANQSFETESGAPQGDVYEEPLSSGVIGIEASSVVLVCFK